MTTNREDWNFAMLPASIILDVGVSPPAFRLFAFLSLKQAQGEEGPTLTAMAAALGTNTRVIKRWLKELGSFGYIKKESAGKRKIRYLLMACPSIAKEDQPIPIPLTEQHSAMLNALASACAIDPKIAGRATMGKLNQTARVLREAGGTPEDMAFFAEYWKLEDWRGRRGSAPVPAQVRSAWGAAMNWAEQQSGASADLPKY